MAFKIYTKKGDKGTTGLFGGARLSKDDIRIEAYGTIDELNAIIAMLADAMDEKQIDHVLIKVQNRLFTIGSNLATDPSKEMNTPVLVQEDITLLEESIDEMETHLSPLKHFVLPGGHPTISLSHLARTVCRRAERRVITLHREQPVQEIILVYLNRLSDYLFVVGRFVAHRLSVNERYWIPREKK